jgi:hypothetical protein
MTTVRFALVIALVWSIKGYSNELTAVVRFYPESVDSSVVITINELFYESLQEFGFTGTKQVVSDTTCRDRECAFAAAELAGAKKVIYCSARKLGSKWIVRAYHYRIGDDKPLSSYSLDCRSIEDFEPVLRRIAEAMVKRKSIEEVASIDNITEKEGDDTRFQRRDGFYSWGFQFGYLYPYGDNSHTYWLYGSDGEKKEAQFKQIFSTDFVSWFELPQNLSLQWDLHVGWRAEMGWHLILLKQFGRGDYSPYVGGGLGMNYCFAGDPPEGVDENKRNSGFTLIGKAGVQLLRTYNFRVHADGGYKMVFNDDRDQGPYANIGIMWRKSPKPKTVAPPPSRHNSLILVLAGIGGFVTLVSLVGIAAQ